MSDSPSQTLPRASTHKTNQTPRGPKIQRVPVHGVLLLDKPLGLSSNDALGKTKWLLRALKGGHTGTLDPLATGLLPLCFGEATKFSQDLLEADKEYVADICLGITTTTGDAEGEVLQCREVTCDAAQIRIAAAQFVGEISQVPPMYSALKKDGKPLYAYARAGETVERLARRVTILEFEILSVELPKVVARVLCSKGTYIRTLAEDLGEALGCGASLTGLRRTRVGDLRLENAVTIEQLSAADETARAALLAPVDALLQKLPRIDLDAEASRRFRHGQRVPFVLPNSSFCLSSVSASESLEHAPLVRLYDEAGALLGVARYHDGVLHPERLMRF